MSQTDDSWVQGLVDDKTWVLHVPSGVVGRALKSKTDEHGTALELSTGDVFIADRGNFAQLDDNEVKFSATLTRVLSKVLVDGLALATAQGCAPSAAKSLTVAALQRGLREIQRPR